MSVTSIHRILLKLEAIHEARPQANLGAILEAVEERGWDALPQRHCSMRLMNMPDDLLEFGIDDYMKKNNIKVTEWKS